MLGLELTGHCLVGPQELVVERIKEISALQRKLSMWVDGGRVGGRDEIMQKTVVKAAGMAQWIKSPTAKLKA